MMELAALRGRAALSLPLLFVAYAMPVPCLVCSVGSNHRSHHRAPCTSKASCEGQQGSSHSQHEDCSLSVLRILWQCAYELPTCQFAMHPRS